MDQPELSIVIPIYNESENIDSLLERLHQVLADVAATYEIVCINDCSTDDSLAKLLVHQHQDERLIVLDLARNFGKEIALTAGLDHAAGQAVIPIDADLQDPPELIPQFVAKWREGYEVVYAQRSARQGETFLKLTSANLFYRVINKVSDIAIPPNAGDFRLMDRKVVEALRGMPERVRFMKGLFAWVGFRQTAVVFDRDPRRHGTSKWNYMKLWRFALDGIFSFSAAPLKIWSYLGGGIAMLAFVYLVFLTARTLISGIDVPGYASIMAVVLFLGGIQLLGIGILGEYIGRIFAEVKARPLYIIREIHGGGSDGSP